MKDPRDWTEEDLLGLPVGEFDWLEVKGRRPFDLALPNTKEADVREILSKAISAFANSGGGFIVLGMTNPDKTQAWQVDDGGISLGARKPNMREWLESISPNLVDSPLTTFNVYAFSMPTPAFQVAPGQAVFVIHVYDSPYAPHQAQDYRYYARVAGRSRPIGHRLVADIMGRRQYPMIQLEFVAHFGEKQPGQPMSIRGKHFVNLIIIAKNTGRVYAQYVSCFVRIPRFLLRPSDADRGSVTYINEIPYVSYSLDNTTRDIAGTDIPGMSRYVPILPGLNFTWDLPLRDDFLDDVFRGHSSAYISEAQILFEIYADNAPKQEGSIRALDMKQEG